MVVVAPIRPMYFSVKGVFSQFLADKNVSVPTLQSLVNYLLLTLYFIPLYCTRARAKKRSEQISTESASNINDIQRSVSSSSQPQSSSSYLLYPWHSTMLQYLLIAICDVEGNFFVVTAYRYTTLTSVQLLDCFNIPIVMVLSRFLLHTRFSKQHLFACFLCLCGLGLCVASDVAEAHAKPDEHRSWRSSLLGDACVLLGCICYGCSNVGQELIVKKEPSEAPKSDTSVAGPTPPQDENEEPSSVRFHGSNVGEGALRWHGYMDENEEVDVDREDAARVADSENHPPSLERFMSEDELSLSRRWEFLAYLGLCGCILSIIQVLLVERHRIMALESPDLETIMYALGFNACLFSVYSLVPLMLLHGSAVILNLSLLTADPFSVAAAVIFFDNSLDFLYFVAFGIIIVGITLYNLARAPDVHSHDEKKSVVAERVE